jgi:hypothetical protein
VRGVPVEGVEVSDVPGDTGFRLVLLEPVKCGLGGPVDEVGPGRPVLVVRAVPVALPPVCLADTPSE